MERRDAIGGTAVNIQENTIDVVKRMGIFEPIRANRLSLARWDMRNADDVTERSLAVRVAGEAPPENEFEIERDVLSRPRTGRDGSATTSPSSRSPVTSGPPGEARARDEDLSAWNLYSI